MEPSESDRNPVDELAEEFVERYRRGERPGVTEYADRHPHLADQIRALFPSLLVLEQARPDPGDTRGTGPEPGPGGGRPERLGDYRIIREVGRGGMGVVYEAEQESLGRHVALKVLPAHALLDPRHLQRFRREARAAARLHHTNIVPVHGVGEQGGLHYYVMQFIPGQGLDQVLVELSRLRRGRDAAADPPASGSAGAVARSLLTGEFAAGDPGGPALPATPAVAGGGTATSVHLPGQPRGSSLSGAGWAYWHSVARIGQQVAGALAYAHAQGVLHRDIKPSNLLLDTRGTVWVTDFGLAKTEADGDDVTHTGDIVGTLRYMAPERFRGLADGRSDLYALGLTLYELLTLRPAFAAADRNQLIAQVTTEEPARPRKLDAAVPRDLETIVLKAIAREPARRYQSPAELAEDLERFLDDRPIKARRMGPLRRTWRWCRRKPALASLAAGLLVAVGAGSVLVTWQWLRAENEATVAGRERNDAETSFRQALAAVDRFYTEVSEDVLLREPGMQPLRRKLLASAREYYREFVARRGGDPRARGELGRAQLRLAALAADLDGKAQARPLYEEALSYLDDLDARSPGVPEYRHALAEGYREFAVLQLDLNEPREAEVYFRKGLEIADALAAANPGSVRFADTRARLQQGLGQALVDLRDFRAAEDVLKEALGSRQALLRDHQGSDDLLAGEADTQDALGKLYHVTGRTDGAGAAWQAALGVRRRLHDKQPGNPAYLEALASTHHNLGYLTRDTAGLAQAETHMKEALRLWEQLRAANPQITRYQAGVAERHYSLGIVYREAGQVSKAEDYRKKAEDCLDRALKIQEPLVESYPDEPRFRRDLGRTHHGFGLVYGDADRDEKAQGEFRAALDCFEQVVAKHADHWETKQDLANTYNSIGVSRHGLKDHRAAEEAFVKARGLLEVLNTRKPGVLECLQRRVWVSYNLSLVYKDTDRLELAERSLRDTLRALTDLGATYPHVKMIPVVRGRALASLGHVVRDLGRCQEALPWYAEAEDQLRAILRLDERNAVARRGLWTLHWGRAQAYEKLGRHTDALADWDRTLAAVEDGYRTDVRLLRAAVAAEAGDHAAALAVLDELAKEPSKTGGLDEKRARVCAAASAAVRGDPNVPESERESRAAALEARALELLRGARAKGFFDDRFKVHELAVDPALAPLRGRTEFQDLVRGLERKADPDKKP